MTVKGIPKTEHIWTQYILKENLTYYITSKENDRSVYYLYQFENGEAVKLGKAKSPIILEENFIFKKDGENKPK